VLLIVFSLNVGAIVTPAGPPAVQETLVFGQERLAPGGRAALRVIVRRADSALPLAGAEVLVSLVKASGLAQQVYAGRTDARGTADVAFVTPEDFAGDAELVVETARTSGASASPALSSSPAPTSSTSAPTSPPTAPAKPFTCAPSPSTPSRSNPPPANSRSA
jgi:hypothetical protein